MTNLNCYTEPFCQGDTKVQMSLFDLRLRVTTGHPLSTYAKFSEKLAFLTPWYAHARVRIRGLEMLVFREILRTYLMDDPQGIIQDAL